MNILASFATERVQKCEDLRSKYGRPALQSHSNNPFDECATEKEPEKTSGFFNFFNQ